MSDPVLKLLGIQKSFGDTPVLQGIDLEVRAGEVVALIGASGSGKSTLLRITNLLESIDDGQIFLSGEDISDPRINQDLIRARIGFVFQQFNLFPHWSVLRNVTEPLRVVHGMSQDQANERAETLLERIGLGVKTNVHPDQLSGGQQQRAAIIRAIASEPELLLLDEITSSLDPQLVGEVLELVKELKAGGATILMATHEIGFAKEVADRVVFLDKGVIHEEGPATQLLTNPRKPRTREFLERFI